MLKPLVALIGTMVASSAFCSTSTMILAEDPVVAFTGGTVISGIKNDFKGLQDNQDGTYHTYGIATYTWSRTAWWFHIGWRAITTTSNPVYPLVSNYPTSPSSSGDNSDSGTQVLWLDETGSQSPSGE